MERSGGPQKSPVRAAATGSWTPGDPLWRQAWTFLRQRGLRALWQRLLEQVVLIFLEDTTIIEFEIPLAPDKPIPIPKTPIQPEVRRLDPEELSLLKPVTSNPMYHRFERFMQQGFQCYIARVDGQVAGYNWYTDKSYHSPVTHMVFPVMKGELFLVYSHTIRVWRSRGIDVVLKACAFRDFQKQGVRTIRTVIEETNRASIRVVLRWGGVPCRQYRYQRWFRRRRITTQALKADSEILTRLAGRIPRRHSTSSPLSVRDPEGENHAES